MEKPFEKLTNIEKWYIKRIKELRSEKEDVMKSECPCHHGLKGYEDTEKCADNNGDMESCVRCWSEVIG